MKRISFLLITALMLPVFAHAQDAATEERLNKLSAQVDDLMAARDAQNKQMEDLAKQVRDLQDQASKPSAAYASPDDLKQLADKLKEVDKKRQDDNERVLSELERLQKALLKGSVARSSQPAVIDAPHAPTTAAGPQSGYEYTVKEGDTLGAIVKAYREQMHIKLTVKMVEDANPGLKPENMRVNQKIRIPIPGQ